MLRVFFVLVATFAFAGPVLADDMDVCRDKQSEPKARLEACDKVIAAGQVSGKHQQQPFTYGSPPGREDFYFVAGK